MASIMNSTFTTDPFLQAMADTLATEMRDYLKKPLMALAEEQIDKSVDAAVAAMKPRIESYIQNYDMSVVINVLKAEGRTPAEGS